MEADYLDDVVEQTQKIRDVLEVERYGHTVILASLVTILVEGCEEGKMSRSDVQMFFDDIKRMALEHLEY